MKKVLIVVVIGFSLLSCTDSGTSTHVKIDSLSQRIDTTADKIWDSTKAKAKVLKDKVEDAIEKRRDSANEKKDTL
jgi:transcription elongation factor Elf1